MCGGKVLLFVFVFLILIMFAYSVITRQAIITGGKRTLIKSSTTSIKSSTKKPHSSEDAKASIAVNGMSMGRSAKRGTPANAVEALIEKNLDDYPASRFETTVRGIIERITGKKFPCILPNWLTYKGKQLELDGYNADIKIAFEAQGPQHTVWKNKYDNNYQGYLTRVENDKAKIRICDEQNVGLIVVDYLVPKHVLGRYIRSRIYDISEDWKAKGLFKQVDKLGPLAYKTGDYIEPIIKVAS